MRTLFFSWASVNLVVMSLFFLVVKFKLSSKLGINDSILSAILLLASIFYFSFRQLFLSYLIVDKKNKYYILNQFFFGLLKLTAVLSLIYFYKTSFSYLIAISSVSTIFIILDIFYLKKFLGTKFDLKIIKKSYLLGFPLILNVISGSLLSYFDRFFIEHYYGYSEVGIYSFAYSFAAATAFVYGPLVIVFEPKIYEKLNSKFRTEKLFTLFRSFSLLGTSILSLLVVFLFPIIVSSFFSDGYLQAGKIINLVLLSTILNVFYLIGNFKVTLKEKTKFIFYITSISCIINIVLNFILIPKYNLSGAALATFISYFIQAVLMLMLTNDKMNSTKLFCSIYTRETLILLLLGVATINNYLFYVSLVVIIVIEFINVSHNFQFIRKKNFVSSRHK